LFVVFAGESHDAVHQRAGLTRHNGSRPRERGLLRPYVDRPGRPSASLRRRREERYYVMVDNMSPTWSRIGS
jgi:hypothetical protein